MTERLNWTCQVCGHVGLDDGDDGFYYCQRCGSQADDIIDTGVAEEDLLQGGERGGIYSASHHHSRPVTAEPISLSKTPRKSQLWAVDDDGDEDGVGPTEPTDFGSGLETLGFDDYYSETRLRYVMGIQIMIQSQCRALVEDFNVSPLIVGLVGPLWLRLVALTRVFGDNWADEAIHESESQQYGEEDAMKLPTAHKVEPRNLLGKRAVMIWYKSLRKMIPLSYSLVITYLACHVSREAILPTDILKWALEGKLPYFAAFVEIEKQLGPPSRACPITSSRMFRPSQVVSLQKLESLAASVAHTIGLELPPVNFYAVASRYLRQLDLPPVKILPPACRIYEWAIPAELWLSANELRLPTRVCVMSILIVAIRVLYDINGFGNWEKNLPANDSDFDAAEILHNLDSKYDDLAEAYEYSRDLPTYLKYCKDVVFAGLEPSFEDLEEGNLIEDFWNFYQEKKGDEQTNNRQTGTHKRSRDDKKTMQKEGKKFRENNDSFGEGDCSKQKQSTNSESTSFEDQNADVETGKERSIQELKTNMEENRFCYIPPRTNIKRFDYIHYARKKDEGAYAYAAHADYYILLRSCARAAQVDVRTMHLGVLCLERRLNWLENRIEHCLQTRLSNGTICCDEEKKEEEDEPSVVDDDSMDFSRLNL